MKEAAKKLSGVILAGGRSSRFGRDKSQMELSGERVLGRLLEIFGAFPFQRLAVIAAKKNHGDWPGGATIFEDDQAGLGPIGGISTALRRLPGGILIAACDMPMISAPLIEWLLSHHDPDFDAVIPRHPGGIEPLFAIYEKSLLPALDEAIRNRRYALHFALEKAHVRYVEIPQEFSVEREFANINTPEDYDRVAKLLGKKS